MLDFLRENLATIIIVLLIAAALAGAIAKIIRDKKSGSTCSGGCGGCASSGSCRPDRQNK